MAEEVASMKRWEIVVYLGTRSNSSELYRGYIFVGEGRVTRSS